MMVEDLEGRQLLAQAFQPVVTLPPSLTTSNIISGPDGDLWIGVSPNTQTVEIDRIGLDGRVTSFPLPVTGQTAIASVTTGPDGNVWFVANDTLSPTQSDVVLGDVTPSGQVTMFPPIPVPAGSGAFANGIVSGPGGDLWFGYDVIGNSHRAQAQSFIGRVTTAGDVTLFPIDASSVKSPLMAYPVVAGPDGNLWFTAGSGRRFVFGRMSPTGVVTTFPIRSQVPAPVADVPDGHLLSIVTTRKGRTDVIQVSTSGVVTRDRIPTKLSGAFDAYLGSADGSLWFDSGAATHLQIGQITPGGGAVSYNLSTILPGQQNLSWSTAAVGSDGQLYVLDNPGSGGDTISTVYRFSPDELPAAIEAGHARS